MGHAERLVHPGLGRALPVGPGHDLGPPGRARGELVHEGLLRGSRGEALGAPFLQHGVERIRLAVRGTRCDDLDLILQAGGDPPADSGRTLVADHGADAGGAEAELELGLLEGRIHRDNDRAQGGDRMETGNKPGVVEQHQADRVTGTYPTLEESARQALDPLHQIGEDDALVPVDERRVVGPRLRLLVEELHQHRRLAPFFLLPT